jgi:FtsZ-binding cell division protein ZapB
MATRGAVLSPAHVEALNMIDLEFAGGGKKNEQVRRRWREYLDQLASLSQDPEQQKEQLPRWAERNRDLLADLLHDMGSAVGYEFDRVQILRGIYTPLGHANFEFETQAIRRLLLEVLIGNRPLPLDVRSLPVVGPDSERPVGEAAASRTTRA